VEIPIVLKVKVAYQASKGMHFLHSSGIVHRDLKSLNLLLDSKWNVKVRSPEHDTTSTQRTHTRHTHTHDAHDHTLVGGLTGAGGQVSDFGLTKFKEDMKKSDTKEPVGSVHWTAPEILQEAPDIDFVLTDVYSFGIIMWELLTRLQPYLGMR